MKANLNSSVSESRICRLCQQSFVPHPKVKDRQKVCSRRECQRLRQKLNRQAWLEKNPVDYRQWYGDYGKPWQAAHPDYQRHYRQQQHSRPASEHQRLLNSLLSSAAVEKKEELNSVKTANIKHSGQRVEKKEELGVCFYLLKAHKLMVLPLSGEKKEELACYFS